MKSAFLSNTRLLLEVPMENKSNMMPCVGGLFYRHKDRVFWDQTWKCLALFAVLCLLRSAGTGGSSTPPNLNRKDTGAEADENVAEGGLRELRQLSSKFLGLRCWS